MSLSLLRRLGATVRLYRARIARQGAGTYTALRPEEAAHVIDAHFDDVGRYEGEWLYPARVENIEASSRNLAYNR
jgi:hypothetical protein